MQVVIEISEERYNALCMRGVVVLESQLPSFLKALRNGIVLPKGHGDLIQREDAETIFKNARKALLEQSRKEQIKDLQTRDMMLLNAEQFIHLIHPIIEADKDGD